MRKSLVENRIGLSNDEFNQLVENPVALNKHQEATIENCDLSKSALELASKDDLVAINEITKGLNKKYNVKSSFTFAKKVLILSAAAIIAITSILTWNKNNNDAKQRFISTEAPKDVDILENKQKLITGVAIEKTTKGSASVHNNEIKTVVEKTVSKDKIQNNYTKLDEKTDTTKSQEDSEIEVEEKHETTPSKTSVQNIVIREPIARSREVVAIKAIKTVPNKYKSANYQINDLVDYNGGTTALEKELYAMLKGNIKNDDIPKNHSSVVFKFEVSAKGKVKTVDVQSVTTPELRERIKNTVLELENWDKGRKRIPLEYTIYVTFK